MTPCCAAGGSRTACAAALLRNALLGHWRQLAPYYCEPWVVREVLAQHLHSPAMWAIFPLQDLLGMDAHLRRPNPHDELINVPSNPSISGNTASTCPWKSYSKPPAVNEPLRELVEASGRGLLG
ncbi:MAG: 4-alpha-glucanotransferase [Hymenobacter sp.]